MKICIAGGGIGGLTAALCLQKSGYEITVFEQASGFSEVGAGLQCGANALTIFDYLGLLPQLEKLIVAPHRVDFLDSITAKKIYSSTWGDEYQRKYGQPYWHIHRADLLAVLVNELRCTIEFNSSITSFTETESGVSVTLQDGRCFDGDLLIGADGIKSVVRQQLFGDLQPRYTGNVAWRGVVDSADLSADFMDKITSNFMGQGKHMVVYYLRDQQLVNFVGVVQNKNLSGESWSSQAPWHELKADFDGWHPRVQTLINAMRDKPCYRWALHDHKPLQQWSSKRVTLLGDAAHATLPFMASGAAMAIEDARILQRSLDQISDVTKALHCYQRNRIPRTTKVQADSARFGKLYHIQNSFALNLAFKALNQVAKRKESFLPSYNANTVELI